MLWRGEKLRVEGKNESLMSAFRTLRLGVFIRLCLHTKMLKCILGKTVRLPINFS